MIKQVKNPEYGDIKKSRVKFAFTPKKFKSEDGYIWVWLEKYRHYYVYTQSKRCDLEDHWKYSYSEII